jgi:hypothetical protein
MDNADTLKVGDYVEYVGNYTPDYVGVVGIVVEFYNKSSDGLSCVRINVREPANIANQKTLGVFGSNVKKIDLPIDKKVLYSLLYGDKVRPGESLLKAREK